MTNHEKFKETFEQIELRSSRIEELKNIQIVKLKHNILRYAAAIVVTFSIVLLTCNGICYAMTGNNVVEKVINRYKKLTEEEVRVNNDILSELKNSRRVDYKRRVHESVVFVSRNLAAVSTKRRTKLCQ